MRREGLSLGRARRLAGTQQARGSRTACAFARMATPPVLPRSRKLRKLAGRAWADSAHVGRSWPDDVTSQ